MSTLLYYWPRPISFKKSLECKKRSPTQPPKQRDKYQSERRKDGDVAAAELTQDTWPWGIAICGLALKLYIKKTDGLPALSAKKVLFKKPRKGLNSTPCPYLRRLLCVSLFQTGKIKLESTKASSSTKYTMNIKKDTWNYHLNWLVVSAP